MEAISTKDELTEQLSEWRAEGDHIALVPTMGNLHAGHLSLIDAAREHAERVVVSVFVNPTQFGVDEDFDDYPRTLDRDTRRLRKVRADVLFAPDVETIYPFGIEQATQVIVPQLTDTLCGAHRPGHFDGVTTVVTRLFALVQPDVALFGLKDFQQQMVIRRMTEDLHIPINIVSVPTVREEDGLAMSSRNSYLDETQRAIAPELFKVLNRTADEIRHGESDFAGLESLMHESIAAGGFRPEYAAIRNASDLSEPTAETREFAILVAAYLGETRLIDNVRVSR
ncbi:MAG: pantoate--beta-alanine ligase [Pseudomonadota bacterium]